MKNGVDEVYVRSGGAGQGISAHCLHGIVGKIVFGIKRAGGRA